MEKFVDDNNLGDPEKASFWDFKSKYEFVDDWFLMSTPYPIAAITAAYLLFVLKLGPEFMKNRKPYQLKNILLAYNIFQVVLSAAMFKVAFDVMLEVGPIQRTCKTDTYEQKHRGFGLMLQIGPVQRTCMTETYEQKHWLATLTYYYFSCKITELADTVLFVLRKKQNQVTFLHVYHHTIMVWNGWVFLKYEPGYWMLFLGTMNSFVHIVMYSYYGLSAYPKLQKYLWWKKYITTLQLVQFGLMLLQMTVNAFVNECKVSKWTTLYFYFNGLLFIYLFSSFYKQSYVKPKKIENDSINGLSSKSSLNQKEVYTNGTKYRNKNGKKNNVSLAH